MQGYKIEMPEKRTEQKRSAYPSSKERKMLKQNTMEHCMQEIYQNARLNMIAIEVLHPYCKDKGFSNLLKRQYEEYAILIHGLISYCDGHNIDLKTSARFAKFFMSLSSALNLLTEKNNSRFAELIMQGIELGIYNITKIQNMLSERAATNEHADKLMMLYDQNKEDMQLFL